ncbi:nondiscriminating glutamyl-tRNA synthetase [Mesobacillus persicus]|uniref:Glutamate--tRNA ligase n=1 Tax=Mesobacillus persicus TaxID=930146 RepID=A0A1H8J2J7_9BACI|nr:glutamate--tRNA ligase [Mesobacillus persicus]SEN75133.1 nondiscriminating glutamyl-tRNA synthetase [Mesobacillus persicus]
MSEIRVRYAPSPTGHLHIGNARTALFNYLFARNQGGKFIIRIEDTDLKRNIEGGEESQLQYLKWLGMDWDESVDVGGEFGPYRQSERISIYDEYTKQLFEKDLVYKCYCTEEELEADRAAQMERNETPKYSGRCRHLSEEDRAQFENEGRKPSVRFKVPAGQVLRFDDMVKGEVSFESEGFGDFVIVKKDGIPTYNYAVVLDDYLMKISHVLRGDDHISNTPKQLLIYDAFGWKAPVFGHMTLIVNESRKKLSKRDESIIQFIEQYEELGYLPEALFNFITLLGWSPSGEEEIFTKEEIIEKFDAARLSKSPALFDRQKLSWMNNQYMKKAELERVIELALPHLVQAGKVKNDRTTDEETWVRSLISLYQEKMSYGAEIVELSEIFFQEELTFEDEAKDVLAGEQVPEVLRAFLQEIESLPEFTAVQIKGAVKAVQKGTGHKGQKLFMPIRSAVTGQTHGPDLMLAIELLGFDKVKKRVENLLA